MSQTDRIINLEEAAQIVELSASRLRLLVAQGRLPSARRIGKGWAVLESDVRRFLQIERRAGRPWLLRGSWIFMAFPPERQNWLVYRTKSLMVEPANDGFRLIFLDLANSSWDYVVERDVNQEGLWEAVIFALEHWATTIEKMRPVKVDRRWTHDVPGERITVAEVCLLYTSDAADE